MACMSENICAIEELDSSQEDTPPVPEIHGTVRHFEHKNNIIVNLIFLYWKLTYFDTSFLITYISETVMQILSKFATFPAVGN